METVILGVTPANAIRRVAVSDDGVLYASPGYDVVRRYWSNLNLPAGSSNQNDTAVPVGEYWIIHSFYARYIGTIGLGLLLHLAMVRAGSTEYRLIAIHPTTSNVGLSWSGQLLLAPGDNLRVVVDGATAGDDLHAYALGEKVYL